MRHSRLPASQDEAASTAPVADNAAPPPSPTMPSPPVAPRHDGWTPQRQRAFLQALVDSGSVEEAARAVGMSARRACRLRGLGGPRRPCLPHHRSRAPSPVTIPLYMRCGENVGGGLSSRLTGGSRW